MEDAPPPEPSAGTEPPDRRNPKTAGTWTGEERRRLLEEVGEFERLSETFRSIRQNRPPDRKDNPDGKLPTQTHSDGSAGVSEDELPMKGRSGDVQ